MKKIGILMLVLVSGAAFADNCDKPRDDFDGLYCLNKVYQESDNELNSEYAKLRALLSKEEKKRLKESQLAWIKERNQRCSLKQGSMFFVNLKCAKDITVQRSNVIRDRIRECKATGCQSSKL
jgi:uncharacterized protein YecT (DUF1311 family)